MHILNSTDIFNSHHIYFRFSVFFVTRADGVLDVWDLLETQHEPVITVKVCDYPLRTLRTNIENGRLLALGNERGTTSIIEFNENLSTISKNDKLLMTLMLDRENHREKILEARARELKLKAKLKANGSAIIDKGEDEEVALADDPHIQQAERDYFSTIEETLHPTENAPVKDKKEEEYGG